MSTDKIKLSSGLIVQDNRTRKLVSTISGRHASAGDI